MKNEKLKIGIFSFITLLVITPLFCQAFFLEDFFDDLEEWVSNINNETNTTQITNEVNVSTNTGNNVINGDGEVIEGEKKSEVHIKNIINGEEIEPIDIESEANEVKVESEIRVDEGIAQVQREIEIDSEKSVENYEVDLGSPEVEQKDEGILKENLNIIQEWWSDFVEGFQSFFQNIFNF